MQKSKAHPIKNVTFQKAAHLVYTKKSAHIVNSWDKLVVSVFYIPTSQFIKI